MSQFIEVIESIDDYRPLYHLGEVWLPAMQAICQRHGYDADSLRRAELGSAVVFFVESDKLIKLYGPLWPEDHKAERAVLAARVAVA